MRRRGNRSRRILLGLQGLPARQVWASPDWTRGGAKGYNSAGEPLTYADLEYPMDNWLKDYRPRYRETRTMARRKARMRYDWWVDRLAEEFNTSKTHVKRVVGGSSWWQDEASRLVTAYESY